MPKNFQNVGDSWKNHHQSDVLLKTVRPYTASRGYPRDRYLRRYSCPWFKIFNVFVYNLVRSLCYHNTNGEWYCSWWSVNDGIVGYRPHAITTVTCRLYKNCVCYWWLCVRGAVDITRPPTAVVSIVHAFYLWPSEKHSGSDDDIRSCLLYSVGCRRWNIILDFAVYPVCVRECPSLETIIVLTFNLTPTRSHYRRICLSSVYNKIGTHVRWRFSVMVIILLR